MSTFTVKYRDRNGKAAEEVISAASRSDAFNQLRRRGISPISITEGGQMAAASGGVYRRKKVFGTALVAVLSLVLVVYLAWPSPEGPSQPPTARVAKQKSKPIEKTVRDRKAVTNAIPVPEQVETNRPLSRKEKMIAKYGQEPKVVKPGGKYRNGERLPDGKRSPFKFAAEREIDRIISAEPGHRIIGRFPKGFIDRDFRKSLETPIEITSEDSPEDVQKKQQMISIKEQLKTALNRGESIDSLLEEARSEVNALADFRDNMIKNLAELKKKGGSEQEIEDYYQAANKMLAEKKIKPLLTPFQIREKVLQLQATRGIEHSK